MKKMISILLLAVMVLSLTACNFTQNMGGIMAGDAEATAKVEEMMVSMAEKRTADAKALMHPEVAGKSDAFAQFCQGFCFLDGSGTGGVAGQQHEDCQ